MTEQTPTTSRTWTVAWRKPTANRFTRVTGPALTWEQSQDFGRQLAEQHPNLQVWNLPTADAEACSAARYPHLREDVGNILTDAGKRVRVVEGTLPGRSRTAPPVVVLYLALNEPVPAGTADGTYIVRPYLRTPADALVAAR